MFSEFIENGNFVTLFAMLYVGCVMFNISKINKHHSHLAPPIVVHPISDVIVLLSLPMSILPAVYVGIYSGWLAGLLAWVGLAVFDLIFYSLGVRRFIGLHFIAASILLPISYYMFFMDIASK